MIRRTTTFSLHVENYRDGKRPEHTELIFRCSEALLIRRMLGKISHTIHIYNILWTILLMRLFEKLIYK